MTISLTRRIFNHGVRAALADTDGHGFLTAKDAKSAEDKQEIELLTLISRIGANEENGNLILTADEHR
jgi:hypothetical protein